MTQIINELKALEAQPLLPQLRPNQGFHNTSKFRVSALLASFLIILFSLQNLSLNRDNEEAILWQEIKSSKILFGSDENGPKFLSRAIALDNKVMVEYILMHGGNYVDDNQRIHAKPLHVASVEGLFPTAKYLLQSGDKVDTITKYNWTPLHWACYNGHVQIVELLLEYGADINFLANGCKKGFSPLYVAAMRQMEHVELYLLKKGANITVGESVEEMKRHAKKGEDVEWKCF